MELKKFLLRPFPEFSVCDAFSPQRELLIQLFRCALQEELEVVVDGVAVGTVPDIQYKYRIRLKGMLELAGFLI